MGRIIEHHKQSILIGPRPAQIGWKTTEVDGKLCLVKVYESLSQAVERQETNAPLVARKQDTEENPDV